LVAAYERFIAEFEKDPRVAEAMMDVAGLMAGEFPRQGLKPNDEGALLWCRKAAATAIPATPLWIKANRAVAGRVGIFDAAEARRLFQKITEQVAGDSLTLARVEHDLQQICLREHDLAGAEIHCYRILGWYRDPTRVPKEDMEKFELDRVIASAGGSMLQAYVSAPWPKAERKRRIQALAESNPYSFELAMERDRALEQLREMPEVPETVVFDKTPDPRAWWRWGLTMGAVLVLVVIGYLVYRPPWRRVPCKQ
jgi:hypothetical protein